jgi:hypothetical protein
MWGVSSTVHRILPAVEECCCLMVRHTHPIRNYLIVYTLQHTLNIYQFSGYIHPVSHISIGSAVSSAQTFIHVLLTPLHSMSSSIPLQYSFSHASLTPLRSFIHTSTCLFTSLVPLFSHVDLTPLHSVTFPSTHPHHQ